LSLYTRVQIFLFISLNSKSNFLYLLFITNSIISCSSVCNKQSRYFTLRFRTFRLLLCSLNFSFSTWLAAPMNILATFLFLRIFTMDCFLFFPSFLKILYLSTVRDFRIVQRLRYVLKDRHWYIRAYHSPSGNGRWSPVTFYQYCFFRLPVFSRL